MIAPITKIRTANAVMQQKGSILSRILLFDLLSLRKMRIEVVTKKTSASPKQTTVVIVAALMRFVLVRKVAYKTPLARYVPQNPAHTNKKRYLNLSSSALRYPFATSTSLKKKERRTMEVKIGGEKVATVRRTNGAYEI